LTISVQKLYSWARISLFQSFEFVKVFSAKQESIRNENYIFVTSVSSTITPYINEGKQNPLECAMCAPYKMVEEYFAKYQCTYQILSKSIFRRKKEKATPLLFSAKELMTYFVFNSASALRFNLFFHSNTLSCQYYNYDSVLYDVFWINHTVSAFIWLFNYNKLSTLKCLGGFRRL